MERRLNFYKIFNYKIDGSLELIQPIRIGGIQFDAGSIIGSRILFSGIDIALYIGRDFLVEEKDESLLIKGIY